MSREVLYIPTGEIVHMLTGEKDKEGEYIVIPAGIYIDSGNFEKEFSGYAFYDKGREPFDLFLAFMTGEIREEGELIFNDYIYKRLKILKSSQKNVHRTEFEIISV